MYNEGFTAHLPGRKARVEMTLVEHWYEVQAEVQTMQG